VFCTRIKPKGERRECDLHEVNLFLLLFLMASMIAALTALPIVNAQFGPQINTTATYAFVGAKPNPIGVGQPVLIHFGITASLPNASVGFTGVTVTVMKPDGSTETLGPFRTDSTGGSGTTYMPTMAGNYVLQTHFPEQWFNFTRFTAAGIPVNTCTLYKASDSDKLTLVVEEEPRP
jgi:hypothetical protein